MIDDKEIMPFNFFKYGGVYSGDHCGMRYVIKRIGSKPDFKLEATVWPGPYCYADTSKDLMMVQESEYSEEGREAVIEWIKQQYEAKKELWDGVLPILDAPINMDCYIPKEEKKEKE